MWHIEMIIKTKSKKGHVMKNISKCKSCVIKGYCPDLCRVHMRNRATWKNAEECYTPLIIKHTKTAALGAGIGLGAAFGGLAAIPTIGLKGLFGHLTAAKLSAEAGGGVTGAGINIVRHKKNKNKKEVVKDNKKRRHFCFPLNLNGGDADG